MSHRDDTTDNERGRESNGGREFYPGSHGFDEHNERGYETRRFAGPERQPSSRSRLETPRWERQWGTGREYESGAHELGYGGGAGRYGEGYRGGYGRSQGVREEAADYQGRRDEGRRSEGRYDEYSDRPSWQNQQPAGERPHRYEQYRPEQQGRTRYREGVSAGHFPRDEYGHEHSSERLFDREPFSRREDTRYYGTGAPGRGGPGFTGGAYSYGSGPRDQHRSLEDEYSDESAMSYEHGYRRGYGTGIHDTYDRYGTSYRSRPYARGPKGYQRSDERLKEDISERLMEAHYIDSSEVTVEVRGAKVTLEGTVPTRHMKHAIEDLVDACPGIQDIDNRIRVASAVPYRPSAELVSPSSMSAGKSQSVSGQQSSSQSSSSGTSSTSPGAGASSTSNPNGSRSK